MKTIRVLVADESVFIRQQLTKMLSGIEDITVIGGAANGGEAVVKVMDLYPSVVLMGCRMPLVSGFEALVKIRELTGIPVIMTIINRKYPEEDHREATKLGAADSIMHRAALLSKDIEGLKTELIMKIRRVSAEHEVWKKNNPQPSLIQTVTKPKPVPPIPTKAPYSRRRLPPGIISIIIIGISTGGPPALQEVISRLPSELPVPVIVVQHMPAEFTQPLARRLNTMSRLEVVEARHGMRLTGGMIVIAPGGRQMLMKPDKTIAISHNVFDVPYCPSIDITAGSVVEVYGSEILGVMMTGMGNDGLLGFRKIHQAGGYILAQDEASSVVYGMPKAVIDDAIVQEIHPLSDLPEAIASCFKLHADIPSTEKA